ncbi:hypothetical protein F4680DRAFT_257367 [Xylaria scruposa]|nr:hypothetical protein F4680DRAFT_257367 [Xylaria scruposa]
MDTIYMNVPFSCVCQDLVHREVFTISTPEHQSSSSLVPMLECLLANGADPAYLIWLGAGQRTSLLIELVVHIMRTQNQSLTEATRLLVRATTVDKETLSNSISRLYFRTFYSIDAPPPDSLFKKALTFLSQRTNIVQQDKNTRYLKLALENLRSVGKSDLLINHEQEIGFHPNYSVRYTVYSTYSAIWLTPGAKCVFDIGHDPRWEDLLRRNDRFKKVLEKLFQF